jgi:hypothetical protein
LAIDIRGVSSREELCAALQCVDIAVPERTKGRTTQHTETWTLCRLLSTLANARHLSYPLSISHRDRPDFLIEAAGVRIGVEVTEATSGEWAHAQAIAENEERIAWLEPQHFSGGVSRRPRKEILQLLRQDKLTSDGWAGDQMEREWVCFMQRSFDDKLVKLARPEFDKFDENWLCIYDNTPSGGIHIDKAINFLQACLADAWHCVPTFDVLFIESGSAICRITSTDAEQLAVHDLWP